MPARTACSTASVTHGRWKELRQPALQVLQGAGWARQLGGGGRRGEDLAPRLLLRSTAPQRHPLHAWTSVAYAWQRSSVSSIALTHRPHSRGPLLPSGLPSPLLAARAPIVGSWTRTEGREDAGARSEPLLAPIGRRAGTASYQEALISG